MTLVDTHTMVDFLHDRQTPQTQLLDQQLGKELFILGDLVYYELLRGFRRNSDLQLARAALEPMERQALVNQQSVEEAAEHFRLLRSEHNLFPDTTQMLLATHCMINNLPLLFSDDCFAPMVDKMGLIDRLGTN